MQCIEGDDALADRHETKDLEYMSCACMATSVAMVIYAHSPHLNEPLHGGSPQDSLETETSAMELQLTVAPKTSIVI